MSFSDHLPPGRVERPGPDSGSVRPSRSWLGRQIPESGELRLEQQLHSADGAVAVLGQDHFGDAAVGGFGVVVLVAINHQHEVGVLFDRARFPEVAEHGPFVGA